MSDARTPYGENDPIRVFDSPAPFQPLDQLAADIAVAAWNRTDLPLPLAALSLLQSVALNALLRGLMLPRLNPTWALLAEQPYLDAETRSGARDELRCFLQAHPIEVPA